MDPALALEASEVARHRVINETIARGDSQIQQFYSGAVVFITGGSGFLGKQLIEKLFRSCQIKKMYVLLRRAKQKTVEERLKLVLEDPAFEYLFKSQPKFADKIVPVSGDITKPRVGISDENWTTITEEVDIIVHGAATINFADPLKVAVMTNVHGTREMLMLGKACKRLRSYVHISTAYTGAVPDLVGGPVPEEFLKCPIPPNTLIELVQQYDTDVINEMTPEMIKPWPNTYSFTKTVAEEAVRTIGAELPICIVRPAIVINAYREPVPGWIDKSCVMGPSGFVVGSGLGILRVIYGTSSTCVDLVPVDLVNNAVIAAAFHTVERRDRGETDVRIYTVSAARNPKTFGSVIEYISTEGRLLSTNLAVWYGFVALSGRKPILTLLLWLLHFIPGYIIDGVLFVLKKKQIMNKLYTKAYQLNDVLGFYMNNAWNFGDSNLCQLYWRLSPADRTVYNFNTGAIDWDLYLSLWCIGCRRYIIKDGLKDTAKAVRKQYLFRVLHYVVMALYGYVIYKIFYTVYSLCYFVIS